MELIFVVHQFFPYARSGTEQYCLAIAREARRRGDRVTILSLHWAHDRSRPTISVVDEPYDGFPVLRINHWRGINPNDVLRDYENRHLDGWFRDLLDSIRPGAVHFFHLRQLGANLIRVAKQAAVRSVVHLMDFWFLCPRFTLLRSDGALCEGPPDGGSGCVPCNHPELAGVPPQPSPAPLTDTGPARLRALLDRPAAQLLRLADADVVFAPSQFLAAMFGRNGFRHPRLHVVPYGLEPGRIERRETHRPRSPLRLGFCGVFSPWKAPLLAVQAVREARSQVRLTLHGDDAEPMFADYVSRVKQAAAGDDRIAFAGAYEASAASDVFAGLDALIVPSTWYENTPFVVLEAFAAGVPVIASDLGGLSEIVDHGGNGLLFRAGDPADLAAHIDRLASDPLLYGRLRPAAPPTIAANYDQFVRAYSG